LGIWLFFLGLDRSLSDVFLIVGLNFGIKF
jgi:hypothetical protein